MKISRDIDVQSLADEESVPETGILPPPQKYGKFFDSISGWILVVLTFLLPLFILFAPAIGDEVAKRGLLAVGILVSFLCWLLARLEDGVFRVHKSALLGAGILVGLSALVATLFSPGIRESLIGVGTEVGTFASIIISLLLLFLVSVYAQSRKHLSYLYLSLAAAGVILFLVQLLHIAGGISFGSLLGTPTDNLLGKWNDLGLFFGLLAVLSLAAVELFPTSKTGKGTLLTVLLLSGVAVLFVNFNLAWLFVAIAALLTLVYKFSLRIRHGAHTSLAPDRAVFQSPAFALMVIALLCFGFNGFLSSTLLNPLQLGAVEVRPSWSSTYEIAKSALGDRPFVGTGPNRFVHGWLREKPTGVNDTIFWNSDFNNGVGTIPTFAATSGALGIIAWLLFLGAFLFLGIRSLFRPHEDHVHQSLRFLAFIGALYLWMAAFFYIPDTVLWTLAFLMTGIFVATGGSAGEKDMHVVQTNRDPRLNFLAILLLIALVLVSLVSGYFLVRRYSSLMKYQKALYTYAQNSQAGEVETRLLSAIKMDTSVDMYHRSLVDVYLIQMNQLLTQTSGSSQDVLRSQFQTLLSKSLASANSAVALNQENYQNWLSLGKVYESVVPLKIEGAYDLASKSYAKALEVNPYSPQIYMIDARLQIAKGDRKKAREVIGLALQQKGNYTDALFALSQLDYADGNIKAAIASAEQVALLAPNDIGVFFQLGFLRYLNHEYAGAVAALERARELNPNYANAKYFLGLSYATTGQTTKALKEFRDIQALNPDNAEVKTIIQNLLAGNAPLSGIGAPANAPEKRPSLPVAEEAKPTTKKP